MFRDVYAGTNQVHLPKAELQVTKILSIKFWAAASELTTNYCSKCYLHDISTARAHDMTLNATSSLWALEPWSHRDRTAVNGFTRFGQFRLIFGPVMV